MVKFRKLFTLNIFMTKPAMVSKVGATYLVTRGNSSKKKCTNLCYRASLPIDASTRFWVSPLCVHVCQITLYIHVHDDVHVEILSC